VADRFERGLERFFAARDEGLALFWLPVAFGRAERRRMALFFGRLTEARLRTRLRAAEADFFRLRAFRLAILVSFRTLTVWR
jgi:hypothetical protein